MRPKKTILCVDDNEQALSVRKFMLETRGYRVLTAAGSEQALELFREGGIDLVLSDLIMPYMDGNELVRRMKELAPEVPTILISGSVKAYRSRQSCRRVFAQGRLFAGGNAGAHSGDGGPKARPQESTHPGSPCWSIG